MQRIQKNIKNEKLIEIYTQIIGINYDLEINVQRLKEQIYDLKPAVKMKNFLFPILK